MLDNDKDTVNFLANMKRFEDKTNHIPMYQMRVTHKEVYPYVYWITKLYIDFEKADYQYMKKFMDILQQSNIRKTVISCIVAYWMVELGERESNASLSGRAKLTEYYMPR